MFLLFLAGTLSAREHVEADGSVLLPMQKSTEISIQPALQNRLSSDYSWRDFVSEHGHWSVQWNEATKTPHRAFGKAVKINGFSSITALNVAAASMRFLQDHAAALRIRPGDLGLVRADYRRNRWYVSYRQQYKNIEVLFSEVELRIFENAAVMAFGVDVYPIESLSTIPRISFAEARTRATGGLRFNPATDKAAADPSGAEKLWILPRRDGTDISYHLVYRVNVETRDPVGNFITFVDAHTGEIIWRHNLVREIDTQVTVSSDVVEVLPTDPYVQMANPLQYVDVNGQVLTTGASGVVETDVILNAQVTMQLRGPWVNVNRQDGPDAEISVLVGQGDSLLVKWDDGNSHPAERIAFFHTNIIHEYVKALDPALTALDYAMPCAVNINDNCNAFWNGTGINFYLAGSGCPNTGQIAVGSLPRVRTRHQPVAVSIRRIAFRDDQRRGKRRDVGCCLRNDRRRQPRRPRL